MRLRIVGDLKSVRVLNAETGEELQGVRCVKIRAGGDSLFREVELELSEASIEMDVSGDPDVYGFDKDKYAHMKLSDVRGLRWLKRS